MKDYIDSATKCLEEEKDKKLVEAILVMSYNIRHERGKPHQEKKIENLYHKLLKEPKPMVQTMREFLTKVGREEGQAEGREEGFQKNLTSLHKALKKRGVHSDNYKKDFEKLSDIETVGDLIVDFMASEDPKAFLKKRFGH